MSSNNNGSSSSKPAIHSFQYDSSSMGSLPSSVNLFRGDFNLPQTLFTLPGRTKNSGLDLTMSLMYESDVHHAAGIWNRDSPTGVLGLGWSLPMSWIEAQSSGSPVAETRSYTYYNNGSGNTLIQQPQSALLFTMPDSLISELQAGIVSSSILHQFLQNGLPLSDSATLSNESNSTWLLDDTELQQQFMLRDSSNNLRVYNGGQSYQLENYRFSQIVYYAKYERWLIVDSSGLRKSFGGLTTSTDKHQTSVNNSISWGVWWAGTDGKPLWKGASSNTEGQVQVAESWHMTSVTDRFGDKIQYEYNNNVEQPVGNGGLPYTKAIYLTDVIDVFGRRVKLSYLDKICSQENADDPREYSDPHRDEPSNKPNAYQDKYETQYLDQIQVFDTNAQPLMSIQFVYQPEPNSDYPAVAEVAGLSGQLKGDTYKRFLTSIIIHNGDGIPQPGMQFEYFLNDSDTGAQRGAMSALTYPQGGRAQLEYSNQSLSICDRTQAVSAPDNLVEKGTPRVFYGSDYVVSTWYNDGNGSLSLQVYTWVGRWISWQLQSDDAIIDTKGLDLKSLGIIADQSFFALYFTRNTDDSVAYIFEKDIGASGQWKAATINGEITAKNNPNLKYPVSNGEVRYFGGASFLLACQTSTFSNNDTGQFDRISWNWSRREWALETTPLSGFAWFTANNEYLAYLQSNGNVVLQYLDGNQNWQEISTQIDMPGVNDSSDVVIVSASSLVAVSQLTASNSSVNEYQVSLLQWNADYQFQSPYSQLFTDYFGANNAALTWTPKIISDSLIAINGNMLRFNGHQWLSNTSLYNQEAYPDTTQRFSYGSDFGVWISASTNNNSYPSIQVLSFDPDANAWNTTVTTPTAELSQITDLSANWPWATDGDYVVLGPNLYFRGTATNWQTVFDEEPLQVISGNNFVADGQKLDSESMLNQGPNFITYATTDDYQEKAVQTLILQNGTIVNDTAQTFDNEFIFTANQEVDNDNGTNPQGPQIFVSYNADALDFDHAETLYLHHYAGYAVKGNIEDYSVTKMHLFDGYGGTAGNDSSVATSSICYLPDFTTAACDASGQAVQYFQNTVIPGTDDPSQKPFGSKVVQYLNGVGDTSGDNIYNMLNGMQLSTQTFSSDETLLSSQTNSWKVFTEVASDPVDGSAETIQLRYGWVTQVEQTNVQNGVTSSQANQFIPSGLTAPYTGQVASSTSIIFNAEGQEETHVTTTHYGVEYYSALRALNILSATTSTINTIQIDSSAPVLVKATAATYASWLSSAGGEMAVSSPAREAEFQMQNNTLGHFPYDSYRPGDIPSGWYLQGRITQRTVFGQVAEGMDPCGVYSSQLFSKDFVFNIAKVPNAANGEFAYLGFEDYEDDSAWQLNSVITQKNNVLTGSSAAQLRGDDNASLSITITPANRSQKYVLGCWYQTTSDFHPDSRSGVQLTVSTDGIAATPIFNGFEKSDGEWRQLSVGVPLVSGNDNLSVELKINCSSNNNVLIDCVFLVPLEGGLLARSYESKLHKMVSLLDSGGRIRRTCYDKFAQPIIQTGLNGMPAELSLNFQSREGNALEQFDPDSPNVNLVLHPAQGGTLERFRDGDAWQQHWQANTTDNWQVVPGELKFIGNSSESLTWVGNSLNTDTWAIYFEVNANTSSPELTLNAAGISIHYSNGAYHSTGAGDCLAKPPRMAQHWLLVRGDNLLLFFGDGQLLFSAPVSFSGADVSITPANAMDFRHLSTLNAPRLGLNYQDATGRQRQVQQLNNSDSLVGQVVYDSINRRLAITRTVPGSFGSGSSLPTLQYRPDFIDQSSFLNNLTSSCIMPGDPTDYYAGQVEDDITRSNDQGYAYTGTRWEESPRQQQVEYGQAGLDYAIANVDQTTEQQRATTQLTVGSNSGDIAGLPSGFYQQNKLISAVKNTAIQVLDNSGRGVANAALDSHDTLVAQTRAQRSYTIEDTLLQASATTQQPNAFTTNAQNSDDYSVTTVVDGQGQTLSSTDNDTGLTHFIYDSCGRLRFVQPRLEEGENGFIYYLYDRCGRMREEGWLSQDWDEKTLNENADDFAWPGSSDNPEVTVSWAYDGTGDDPTQIGRKIQVITTNTASSLLDNRKTLTTTETFSYDHNGRILASNMSLTGAVTRSACIAYSYNNSGEILELKMPEGAPVSCIYYHYNDLGQISCVSTDKAQKKTLASYCYNADGSVEIENSGNSAWTRKVEYLSTGWVKQVQTVSSDGQQSFNLAYQYYADGTYKNRSVEYSLIGCNDNQDDNYSYDAQQRLISATGQSGIDTYHYDANGNILSVDYSDGHTDDFPLMEGMGNNQLAQSNINNHQEPIVYDSQGRMTQLQGGHLSYQNVTNLSSAWAFGDTQTQLAYGGHRQRVFKRVWDSDNVSTDTIYFCGSSNTPVAQLDGNDWSLMVQGPTGLIARITESGTSYPLKDNVGSVWAMVNDEGNLLSTSSYLPFGRTTTKTLSETEKQFDYLFQGREWDAEAGLYNFGDRMYSPQLRRFLTTDPERQYPSPYLFVSNNPLQITDASGDLSTAGQIGIGVATGAAAAAGIAATTIISADIAVFSIILSVVTVGAAAPAAAAVDAEVVAADAVVDTAAVEATSAVVAADIAVSATEGEAALGEAVADTAIASTEAGEVSSEVAAGASATTEGTSASASASAVDGSVASDASTANKALKAIGMIAGSSLTSAGSSGLEYDIQNGQDFSAKSFLEAVGIGAISGLVSGTVGEILGPLSGGVSKRLGKTGKFAASTAVSGIEGAVGAEVSCVLTNLSQQQPWYQGLAKAGASGFANGAVFSMISSGMQSMIDDTNNSNGTLLLKKMATSSSTLSIYASTKTQLLVQYKVWGQDKSWGQGS